MRNQIRCFIGVAAAVSFILLTVNVDGRPMYGGPGHTPNVSMYGAPGHTPNVSMYGASKHTPNVSMYGASKHNPNVSMYGASKHNPNVSMYGASKHNPNVSMYGASKHTPNVSMYGASEHNPNVSMYGAPGHTPNVSMYGASEHNPNVSMYGAPGHTPNVSMYGASEHNPNVSMYGAPGHTPNVSMYGASEYTPNVSTAGGNFTPAPPYFVVEYPHVDFMDEPEQQELVNERQIPEDGGRSPNAPPSTARDLHVAPERSFFVEYPHEYNFVVDEAEQCRQREPFVVVIVPAHPRERANRDTIRRMWGGDTQSPVLGQRVSLFFLLGLPTGEDAERVQRNVLEESADHRDLLQADFLDTYNNLTIKTMVMMEWLESRCPAASYAMKIDTDMFLNVHNLVDMLLDAPRDGYMTGHVAPRGQVIRDKNSKWFLPRDAFPDSHYPPYALGSGYVFSSDLPRMFLEASRHVDAVYMEDVYLGLLMKHLGIPLTSLPFPIRNLYYEGCKRYASSV